jgi:hypothetical protein
VTESKIELTQRLRREGRWSAASKFKDTVIKECRARGMKKAAAAEHGWEETEKAFPPLPTAQVTSGPATEARAPEPSRPPTPTRSVGRRGHNGHDVPDLPSPSEEYIDIDALLERVGDRQPPDLVRDSLWVYENLPNRKVKPEAAPGPGAWSLLQWARKYQNRFFEQVLPKAMAARRPEEEEDQKGERMAIAEIEGILGAMQKSFEEELIANVPETVKSRVGAILGDWSRRFALTIPDDARFGLKAHICGLVQDGLTAIDRTAGAG